MGLKSIALKEINKRNNKEEKKPTVCIEKRRKKLKN
jgi:hypothetical protein